MNTTMIPAAVCTSSEGIGDIHTVLDMVSQSSSTLEAILPVQIEDPELASRYSSMLYPPRGAKKSGSTTRKTYPVAFTYLGHLSSVVNTVLAQARFIYLDLPNLAAAGLTKDALQTHLARNLSIIQDDYDASSIGDSVKGPMGAISSGRSHIIIDSKRFKGGKDIVMSGVPNGQYGGTSTVWSNIAGSKNRLPDLQMQLPPAVVGSEFQDLAYELSESLNRWLYDSPNTTVIGRPGDRTTTQLAIRKGMWDVAELSKVLDTVMMKYGFRQGFGKLTLTAPWPVGLEDALGEFFSFVIVREPNHKYLATTEKHPGITDSERPETEALDTLQPEYGLSLAMNLPEEIVAYITQTKKGKRVPLASLNTWFNAWARAVVKPPRTKINRGSGSRITVANTPRYVLLPSEAAAVAKRRKELGLYSEPGRINEDNLFISNTGRFHYCPPADDVVIENAKNYEKVQEEALAVSFAAGAPLIASQTGYASPYFATKDQDYREKLKSLKSSLSRYAGALQTYSWDYNCILTSSRSDPERLVSIPLTGASKPDSLAISEYLTLPASAALFRMFRGIRNQSDDSPLDEVALKNSSGLLGSSVFASLARTYIYLLYSGKVPDLQTLIDRAAKALDITSVDPAKATEDGPERYEFGLYTSDNRDPRAAVIDSGLKLLPAYTFRPIPRDFRYDPNDSKSESQYRTAVADATKQVDGAWSMLRSAMTDAAGGARSNIMRINVKEGSPIDDDPHYFDLAVHNLGEFSNLYNYLGGRVFFEMVTALSKVNVKDMTVVDDSNPLSIPPFESIVKEVMPFVTFFCKYAPEKERYNAEGAAISEALKADDSVTLDDIHLPGSKGTFQVFPHQFKTMQTLARSEPPRFATLDISPGGGKTLLGIIDIGNLIHAGKIKRPCVLAPNGLVRNWVEDLHSVTEGRWNVIPLTTATYRTWGEERLSEMVQKAPINTIFVVGLSFMKLRPYQVVLGNHVEKVSETLEFCKKFGFDYICLDESHKAKNARSLVHQSVKQMTVASSVKYIRLATGTLIQTKLTDVVGQSALFGAHIFRTLEEYEEENSIPVGTGRATVFDSNTPYKARRQLAKHSAVISFKKKEWAFMLPRPIETFLSVRLDASGDELGQAHQMMYQAVLKATLEEIKKDENVLRLMSGSSEEDRDDDGDGDGDEDEGKTKSSALTSLGSSGLPTSAAETMDDSTLAELESALKPYLQRLEMMLTDPMGDQLASQFFSAAGKDDYVSNKVKKIIERIELNFKEFPWVKGSKYKLKALVDYNGVRYTLMGKKGEKLTLDSYNEEYVSTTAPDKDPRWKPEPFGKVIVFCRYTRSVKAIYKALPPHLKKLAVMFSGEVKDKWGNLESFRTTPYSTDKGVQILVANEQAISEGHNLQMASRIVRVESPWSPGELDQSASRIFRPDTTGKFRRETVYLDHVVCNNTLEVAKLGRLISRMVDKAKFDEADNPLYDPLGELDLYPISMSLDTIAATPMLEDIREYIDAYATFVTIQSSEFEEMRQTRSAEMFDVQQTPMPKGSSIIEHVPYLSGMKFVPDRHNYGLSKLTTFLEDTDSEEAVAISGDLRKLIGKYAHTEFGNGMIVKIKHAKGGGSSKLTSVTVNLANGDTYTGHPSMIYLAENLTKENVADFTPKNRWATEGDKKRAEKEERIRERERLKTEKQMEKLERAAAREALREKKRAAAAKAKKAATTGKAKARKAAPVVEEEDEEEDVISVKLFPVIYNGFLAVDAEPGEDDERHMRKMGFKDFGSYAYCQIKDKISFEALLSWLDKKFYLRAETRRRLTRLSDAFASGRGRKFAIEMAPIAEFKNFYRISHKLSVKDKSSGLPELKIYPVIINGSLFLNVDMSTNPAFRRYLGKAIPGTKSLKFEEADGLWIQFFKSRTEVISWTKDIRNQGIEIENYDVFKERVDGLKDKLRFIQKLAKE